MIWLGWIVGAISLVVLAGYIVSYRRLRAELSQEKKYVLELQRELSSTMGELSDVQTRRKRLLAASTQALVIVEMDYRVSSANKVAKELFGPFKKKKMTFIEWTRQHQLLELVDLTLAGEKTPPLYFSVGERFLEAHARSIKSNKEIIAVALAIHDVTELQRLSRARRDLVTNISHELRTPLASIQLLLETLTKGAVLDDKKATRQMMDRITIQVDTLNQLAQEMLDLSLIESGQMPLRLAVYPLRYIAEQQINRLLPQAERKDLMLNLNIDNQIQVLADEKMVGRVVTNLIHNAIKFTDEGKITVSAYQANGEAASDDDDDESWVTVSVSDTGIGIPPDQVPRIFERFYKIDRARKQVGTGIGLAISRHIVEAHGGRIWAENNPTHGMTFQFTLPVDD